VIVPLIVPHFVWILILGKNESAWLWLSMILSGVENDHYVYNQMLVSSLEAVVLWVGAVFG